MVVLETGAALAFVLVAAILIGAPIVKMLRKYVAWMMKD